MGRLYQGISRLMSRIERYSNWCEIDRLDSIDLKEGEFLQVFWPNGDIEILVCGINSHSYTISDHGHPYSVPVREAYIHANYKGQPIKVELLGLEAQRFNG